LDLVEPPARDFHKGIRERIAVFIDDTAAQELTGAELKSNPAYAAGDSECLHGRGKPVRLDGEYQFPGLQILECKHSRVLGRL